MLKFRDLKRRGVRGKSRGRDSLHGDGGREDRGGYAPDGADCHGYDGHGGYDSPMGRGECGAQTGVAATHGDAGGAGFREIATIAGVDTGSTRRQEEHGMGIFGRCCREGKSLGLVMILGLVLAGCADLRSEVATSYRNSRAAQQAYDEGKAKYQTGDYAGAIPNFQRALSIDPKYDDAEIRLAWSYYHSGKYPDATRHFRQVTARQPRWEGAWNGLGWSQYRVGQYQVALAAFQEAVALEPEFRDAAVGLAYSLFELRRYREALPLLKRLTLEGEYLYFPDPKSDVEEVRSRYAWCLYYTGSYETARDEFVKGIRARPKWHGLHNGLGWTYLKLGDRAKARESFQRALRLEPDYPDARAGLAEANH